MQQLGMMLKAHNWTFVGPIVSSSELRTLRCLKPRTKTSSRWYAAQNYDGDGYCYMDDDEHGIDGLVEIVQEEAVGDELVVPASDEDGRKNRDNLDCSLIAGDKGRHYS